MSTAQYAVLQENIGYRFADLQLLRTALTHPSYTGDGRSSDHNQRLEFLGDAVLGMLVAEWLYAEFPTEPEGRLTRIRASLVREGTLAEAARTLGIPQNMRLGRGEAHGGGALKDSILADAVESIIAAVYLDGGPEPARALIHSMLAPLLSKAEAGTLHRDSKTALQEAVRDANSEASIEYRIEEEWGPPHQKRFRTSVWVEGECLGIGEGTNKKSSEQAAARQAMAARRKGTPCT